MIKCLLKTAQNAIWRSVSKGLNIPLASRKFYSCMASTFNAPKIE